VGKTIVSEGLAKKLRAVHIDIGDLVKREGLASGYDEKRQTWIADNKKLEKRLQPIMSGTRKNVIVDGHYATDVIPKSQISRVFVLRCHPMQLRQRMQARGFEGAKLKENLAAEILDVCLTDSVNIVGVDKVCEIDTTDKTVDAVINEIASVIRRGKRCTVGTVDWLGQLEIEGSLDQYLTEF